MEHGEIWCSLVILLDLFFAAIHRPVVPSIGTCRHGASNLDIGRTT